MKFDNINSDKWQINKSWINLSKKFYTVQNWINEGYGWIIELIHAQCIKMSTFRPLSGRSYINLPAELKKPKKGLINIKNNDQKCFLWCHIRLSNPLKIHPGRITKKDK